MPKLIALLCCALVPVVLAREAIQFGNEKLAENRTNNIFEGIFLTRLDHFRTDDQSKIPFKYHVNNQFYRYGGPVFIYIKDTGDLSTKWIEEGLMVDIARETGAALLTFNYRYFGENIPTNTASFTDLQHLTVEHMLADIAVFIKHLHSTNYRVPTVLWGSGFGGSLAVYARKKYPHLVSAAWASSGVFELSISNYGQYDLLEFLLGYDSECTSILLLAFYEIKDLFTTGQAVNLQNTLDLCHPFETSDMQDIYTFLDSHYNIVVDFIRRNGERGAQNLCRDLTAVQGLSPLNAFARWLNFVIRQGECFDHTYAGLVDRVSNETWNQIGTDSGRRQWYYLQCTQIGTFLVADNYTWLPNIPLDYHLQKCHDLFGQEFNIDFLDLANPALRVFYGETFQHHVPDVIYTSGESDPWLYTGAIFTEDQNSASVIIEGAGKSADLPSVSPLDNVSLAAAKQQIIQHVKRYLE